jgi:hypothetical protein
MILSRAKEVAKEKGYLYVIRSGIQIAVEKVYNFINKDILHYYYYRIFKSRLHFNFNGKRYNYFYHLYNTTWKNERTVEIPIIMEIIGKTDSNTILEVGNVLSHYFSVNHDIVDKYEIAEGVINCDISEIPNSKKYDIIITISTLEHVGWDEYVFSDDVEWDINSLDKTKIPNAIKKLQTLLKTDGKIVVTLPIGYNKILDLLLKENKLPFTEVYYLKRISNDNQWIQVDWKEIENLNYDFVPFYRANGLVIGVIE